MKDKARFYYNGSEYVPSGTTILPKPDLKMWAANCAVDYLDKSANMTTQATWAESCVKARHAYAEKSKQAAGFGTFIHWMCEQYLQGNAVEIPKTWTVPDENPWELEVDVELTSKFMTGLIAWAVKHKVKVIAMEHEVVTKTYGGRLDLVCEMDGVVTLVDFKTGAGSYYPTWKYQLAGYRQAWNKMDKKWLCTKAWCDDCTNCPYNIQSHGILKFNKKTGKVNYKDFNEYQTTRTNPETKEKEKYTRTYETDRQTFNALVAQWWLINRGIQI